MGKFSKLTSQDGTTTGHRDRLPLNIPLLPYLQDHHFMGKTVLPAVEAMQILADLFARSDSYIDVYSCRDITFKKFLPIAPSAGEINAIVDVITHDSGGITASLMTRKQMKKTAMSRLLTHTTLTFDDCHRQMEPNSPNWDTWLQGPHRLIPANRIYADLVPFGPAFQNLVNDLVVTPTGARADIITPGEAIRGPLGSPFALDAAFHGACVWGQCYLGFVPFPVGIKKRLISQPTTSNRRYRATITPIKADSDQLSVDIHIYDKRSHLCETAVGVRMVDVSQGRLKPPDWVIT